MAEITENGFVGTTENEYFEAEREKYLDIDPDWNLDPSTPDGLKVAIDAERFANLDEAAQAAYNSKDPNKARDIELNIISALTGTFRDQGTPSQIVGVVFSGVDNTDIDAGTVIESTADGSQWTTDSDATITGGTATVDVTCTENGATQADPNTVTRLVDTISGVTGVTNPNPAVAGTDAESNAELRLRRALSVGRPGNNQIDSMLGEIGAVDGVRRFAILENDTNVTDSDGLPPHSIAPIVDGGTDADVAMAIYSKKNPGVTLYQAGTPVSVTVTSPIYPTQTKEIKFSRPIYVPITVDVEVTDDGTLPANADDLITQAILDYAAGDLVPADVGFNVLGFDIGEDVPISRMYTPINNVLGQYGNSYVSSLELNSGTVNIAIAFNELSQWAEANINVTVV